MRQNGRALGVQPCVAIRMIEMPVRVDEMSDRLFAKSGEGLEYPRPGRGDAAIDENLSVAPVRTAMFPPDPSRIDTPALALWTLIGSLAAESRIISTMP